MSNYEFNPDRGFVNIQISDDDKQTMDAITSCITEGQKLLGPEKQFVSPLWTSNKTGDQFITCTFKYGSTLVYNKRGEDLDDEDRIFNQNFKGRFLVKLMSISEDQNNKCYMNLFLEQVKFISMVDHRENMVKVL